MAKKGKVDERAVTIPAPKFETAVFNITGTAPYMMHKFGKKARTMMEEKQRAGSTSKKGAKREPRDFECDYEEAQYRLVDGRPGIPAAAFRKAMISACRVCGFQMTRAKLGLLRIIEDGRDTEANQLVAITGTPTYDLRPMPNDNGGMDLRVRARFDEWACTVRVEYDADMFTLTDVANLLMRAGAQVGVGDGRPDSSKGSGCGWGTFRIVNEKE